MQENPHHFISQILIQTTQLAVFIKGKIPFPAASGQPQDLPELQL